MTTAGLGTFGIRSLAISHVARFSMTTFFVSCNNSGSRCFPLESVTRMMIASFSLAPGTSLGLPGVGSVMFVLADDSFVDGVSTCDFWVEPDVDIEAADVDGVSCVDDDSKDVAVGKGGGAGGADDDAMLSNLDFKDCSLSFCSIRSISAAQM